MSHVTLCENDEALNQVVIDDLEILKVAAERCGMIFAEGQRSFSTYYNNERELQARCRHAIKLKPEDQKQGSGRKEYEIGVLESTKTPGAWTLACDFFDGSLEAKAGVDLGKLRMFYEMEQFRAEAHRNGYIYSEIQEGETYFARVEMTTALGY